MIKYMFTVLDTKAQIYGLPFFSVRRETAIRDFLYAAQDPQSSIARYPHDHVLYAIGTFDDTSCVVTPHNPEFICHAFQSEGPDEAE